MAGLKLNIQKMKIVASSPITSRQIDGETMETVTDFIFLGSKITVDGDCSHEIKKCLLLGRQAMTNLDSILKIWDIADKGPRSQSYGFSSSHVQCKSWTIKKADSQRIDAFELWCWGGLLRVHWTARRSNQSILKEINLEFSSEGLMLKLKLQYTCHLMWRTDSLEKSLLILGKIGGRRRRGWYRMKWFDGLTDSMDKSLSKLQEMVKEREDCHAVAHGVAKSQIWLNDWKITKGLAKLCWVIVARVDIIVLFLTLEEKLSVLQHSE